MEEIWKDIGDDRAKKIYEVSNLGKVRNKISGHILKVQDNGFGYKQVIIRKENSNKYLHVYLHRVVAMTFLSNPDNLPQVGHKDHTRENNSVGNLYWTTQSQNTRDGVQAGRINAKKRGKTNQLKPSQLEEIAYKQVIGMGVAEIARSMSLPRTTVSSVLNGRSYWNLFSSYVEAAKTLAIA